MAYTKTNWKNLPNTTTPITAENLNNIENGVDYVTKNVSTSEHSASSTYEAGDYCIYNNELYRCITAITTPEAFTASKWVKTTVTDELNSAIDELNTINNNSKILFNSTSGDTGNITLLDNAENYDYIEIFYHSASRSGSAKIYKGNSGFANQDICLLLSVIASTSFALVGKSIKIQGTSISSLDSYVYSYVENRFTPVTTFAIDKVIGYKK